MLPERAKDLTAPHTSLHGLTTAGPGRALLGDRDLLGLVGDRPRASPPQPGRLVPDGGGGDWVRGGVIVETGACEGLLVAVVEPGRGFVVAEGGEDPAGVSV